MVRRPIRAVVLLLVAAVALLGGLVLPSAPAGATGTPQLAASPSTNLDNASVVHLTLTGADSYEGQTVYFAQCIEPTAAANCGAFSPQAGLAVASGTATYDLKVFYGDLPGYGANAPSCTEANNGTCDIVAFTSTAERIASTPISFEAPPTTTVDAEPNTGLQGGEQVSVTVSPIPNTAGSDIELEECNTAAPGECKFLADGTSANGSYSSTVTVTEGYLAAAPGGAKCDETTTCVIEAWDHDNQQLLGSTPITFLSVPFAFTVTPSNGLKDGDTLAVSASGIPSEDTDLTVAECNMDTYEANAAQGALAGCDYVMSAELPVTNRSLSTRLSVVDGPSQDGTSQCSYATNGKRAIVLFNYQGGYVLVTSQPITFRPPVLGPAQIAATPTSGLHAGSPGAVGLTGGAVPDGYDAVDLVECNIAGVKKYATAGQDWDYKACSVLDSLNVVDNAFAAQKFAYEEGGVGNMANPLVCDHTHACEIFLVGTAADGNSYTWVSNPIAISFRPANFGTPRLTLSKSTGLKKGDKVKVTVTDVPDLVRALFFQECNVKGLSDGAGCYDTGDVVVRANTAHFTLRIHVGKVGAATRSGANVSCTAKTNGQCLIRALSYPGYKPLVKGPVIRFAKR